MRNKKATNRPEWIGALVREVVDRDQSLCINCGALAADVHHIVPRSRAKRWSRKVWREENMCCMCRACHADGQTIWMREKLIEQMRALYGYEEEWMREFGVVVEAQ